MAAYPVLMTDDEVTYDGSLFKPPLKFDGSDSVTKKLRGTSRTDLRGKAFCLEGDEQSVEHPCSYQTGNFRIAGAGVLRIKNVGELAAEKTTEADKPFLLEKEFKVEFIINTSAKMSDALQTPHVTRFPAVYEADGLLVCHNDKCEAE